MKLQANYIGRQPPMPEQLRGRYRIRWRDARAMAHSCELN
jgi:hypothetical protein